MERVVKRVKRRKVTECLFQILESRTLFNGTLMADINQTVGRDYHPYGLTTIGNLVYFSQHDGVHGDELWRTDGTAAGTLMIKDMFPGLGSGAPATYVQVDDGTVFFVATDGATGYELWKTDGTEAGTSRVKDINPGSSNSLPDSLTAVGNKVYFFADDGVHGRELWVSDGSQSGTQIVTDLRPGATGQTIKSLVALNGNLYFYGDDGNKTGLWKSTGAPGNASLVKASVTVQQLTVFDEHVFLSDSLGFIWASDGTPGGTATVQSINTKPSAFVSTGGALFFSRASGTGAGVYRIAAGSTTPISVGGGFTSPSLLTNVNGDLYFTAKLGTSAACLYEVSQFNSTASLVQDMAPGNSQAFLANLAGVGSSLYFTLYTPTDHYVLWQQSAGFSAPAFVQSLEGGGLFAPNSFVAAGDQLVFVNDDSINGEELWSSGGIFGATGLIDDTYPGTASSDPVYVGQMGNQILLHADDGVHGSEPMLMDAAGNITPLGDLAPGPISSAPFGSTVIGNKTVFAATIPSAGRELGVTDGTAVSTKMLKDINPGTSDSSPTNFIAFGGRAYFSATDASHGTEMWVTDGTPTGTALFRDGLVGTSSGGFSSPVIFNAMLYFVAADQSGGSELWRTDGTPGGTVQVKDIYPGTTGSTPANLTVFNGALYFSATDPINGTELWRSDGTNTTLVKNISAGSASSSPAKLMAAGPYLYFNADDGSGIRVWRTDGAETIRLSDTAAANNGFVAFNDKAYFFVTNASKGIDLWQSGGTPQTTSLLKAIMPPPPPNVSPFVPRSLTVADGRLFFLADDGTTGLELWTSDGSAGGTALVQDLTPGTIQGILDNQVFVFNGDVYVDGNDSVSGFEPYRFADTYSPVIWKQALSLQSVPAFTIGFNEQFVPPALSNLVLTNVTTGKQIAAGMMAMSSDPTTQTLRLTFPGFAHGMPPDGNYVLTFPQHTISDLKGNQNATDLVAGFFALAGDANQDRAINFADLVAVAQNYGGVGKTFAQGDFDFDGTVGFSDLVMIAQKYGTTLASPADTVGTEAVLAPLKTETKLLQSSPVQPVKKPAPVKRVSSPVFARRRI